MSKIDVILPTYNQSGFLENSVRSILRQTFKDFTFIIVNDGSTDSTSSKLENLYGDPRIKVINNEKNQGLPSTLNVGHVSGNSPYCTWISTDNIHYEDFLYELYTAITNGNFDFAQSKYFVVDNNIKKSSDIRNINSNWGMSTLGACFLYKREVWETYRYDETMQNAEDLKFYIQAFLHGYRFCFVDKHLADYYCHSASMTAKVHQNLQAHQLLVDRIYNEVVMPHRRKK